MTPDQLRDARHKLGMTQSQLANALRLEGDGRRLVRRWETGDPKHPLRGPTIVAIELLLEKHEREAKS